MLQHFSASPRRPAVWVAAGFLILLLAVLWYFQDRNPAVSKLSNEKTGKTVLRRKIPQDQQTAHSVIRKKIAEPETASHLSAKVPAPHLPAEKAPTESPAEVGTRRRLRSKPQLKRRLKRGPRNPLQPNPHLNRRLKPGRRRRLPSRPPPDHRQKSSQNGRPRRKLRLRNRLLQRRQMRRCRIKSSQPLQRPRQARRQHPRQNQLKIPSSAKNGCCPGTRQLIRFRLWAFTTSSL